MSTEVERTLAPARPAAGSPAAQPRWWRSPRFGLALTGVVLVVLGVILPREDWLGEGAVALTLAIAATGLGIALGLAGEYLLGVSFVVAAGAYPTATLTSTFGWNFWPAAGVGILVGAIVGLLVSLPGLRVSHFYFGMLGFFMVFLVPSLVEVLAPWTGGSQGLPIYTRPELFGYALDAHGMFVLAAVLLTLVLLLVLNVRMSPWSVSMRRMRDAPHVLASTGVRVWRIRFGTYLLVSVLAGLSGAVYSHINVYIQPIEFSFNMTTLILAAVIVGGSRSLLGPSIGLVILYIGPRLLYNIDGIADIVYGVAVVLAVLLFRGGVVQAARDVWSRLSGRRRVSSAREETTTGTDASALARELMAFRRPDAAPRSVTVNGVRKSFGGVRALDFGEDDSVEIAPGSITLLLGPNGSGKTTLLNVVSGLVHADAGAISMGATNITRRSASAVARSGVSRSFQSPVLPDEITPIDLFSAAISRLTHTSFIHWLIWDRAARRTHRASVETARRIATAAGLAAVGDQPCAGLTSGQRRLVDVVCALISPAAIVLLDEPAAGLSDVERKLLAATVRSLADSEVGFIVVEHDLELALSLADSVVVMAAGRPVATGAPGEIQHSETVRRVLLGAS